MKNVILWNYERGTWQYDVFCFLIIAFIFLTPNSWFDKREKLATRTSYLVVKPEDFSAKNPDFQMRVRQLSGDPNAEIIGWSERRNEAGETIYEIETR